MQIISAQLEVMEVLTKLVAGRVYNIPEGTPCINYPFRLPACLCVLCWCVPSVNVSGTPVSVCFVSMSVSVSRIYMLL